MSNSILEGIVKDKDFTFKKQLFKIAKDFNLSLNELLLLIYFLNQDNPVLDIDTIKTITFLEEKEILESFTTLNSKGLLSINMSKSKEGKVNETIDLSNVYRAIVSDINTSYNSKSKENIFETFEKEFARPLSSMEYEIINNWIKKGINEELIIGALKEAIYNGTFQLRYIDGILGEWSKNGFKTMKDVQNHIKKNLNNKDSKNESQVLFEYNWLEDEE